ncbi:MAG: hypothetical protein JWP40_788 [Blastococcus sp.]|jgi:uncharacterized integral membrane protein|nr:hypothetical protein [Blastococcus sp.]
MTSLGPENGPAPAPTGAPAQVPVGPPTAETPPPAGSPAPVKPAVPTTRTGTVWVAVSGAGLLGLALIVFLVQNTRTVEVQFFGLSGHTSLGLLLLIAAVAGVLLTVVIGSARILQLRRTIRRRNKRQR